MTLTELRYWQWLAIGIGAALLAVLARHWSEQDAGAASLPVDLSGQQQRFERALSGHAQGQPLLRNITVYSRQITSAEGSPRPVHLVAAQYCSGLPEYYDGARRFVWRASIFVFPIPYQPTADLARSDPDLAAALARRSPPGGKGTVLDLLAAARSVHGIGFSYAWWDAHFLLIAGGGCLLLMGVILPNVLHVARFGHLKPPRRRKARIAAPSPLEGVSAEAVASQAAVDAEADGSSSEDIPQDAPPLIPVLNAKPIKSTANPPTDGSDPSTFGMKRDDYYPTVRHHDEQTPAKPKGAGR